MSSRALADQTQNADAFFGAFVATYGLRDAVCLVHTAVGCQLELASVWAYQDMIGDSMRLAATNLKEEDFIFGAEQKIANLILDHAASTSPGLITVCPGSGPSLLVEDLEGAIDSIRGRVSCDVVVLPSAGWSGDMFQGFSSSIAVFAERIVSEPRVKVPRSVNVLGYFFHRYEADEVASVGEIRRMLKALGVKVVSIMNEGADVARLRRAAEAEVNLALPYGEEAGKIMESRFGQPMVRTELPIGLKHSCRFLRDVAAAFGLEAKAEEVIDAQLRRVVPVIHRAVSYTKSWRFALFVDAQKTVGMLTYLRELGMVPAVIGLMNPHERVEEQLRAEMPGLTLKYGDFPLLIDPPRYEVLEAIAETRPDLVIGSSTEKAEAEARGFRAIELTFPLRSRRVFYPRPLVGFNGALVIAEEIYNQLYVDRQAHQDYAV